MDRLCFKVAAHRGYSVIVWGLIDDQDTVISEYSIFREVRVAVRFYLVFCEPVVCPSSGPRSLPATIFLLRLPENGRRW